MWRNKDSNEWLGNIYKGKVENVIPGMQAAFVDIGYGINAFLPFSEIHTGEFLLADVDKEDTKPNSKNHRQWQYCS